jgi:hypothetical protein
MLMIPTIEYQIMKEKLRWGDYVAIAKLSGYNPITVQNQIKKGFANPFIYEAAKIHYDI